MLAYLFWHRPREGVDPERYEEALREFHSRLETESACFRLGELPFDPGPGYEDWYLVDGFPALGALNEAAVAGPRRAPHDAAAAWAGAGVAGVMGHVAGARLPARPGWAAWLAKPAGMPYGEAHAQLSVALDGAGAAGWQRQMTLGPATEYCVLAAAPLPLPWPAVHAWPVRTVVAAAG